MVYTCKCGETYPTRRELRLHIAIITPRWPARRCDPEHYDINDEMDKAWIEAHKDDKADKGPRHVK